MLGLIYGISTGTKDRDAIGQMQSFFCIVILSGVRQVPDNLALRHVTAGQRPTSTNLPRYLRMMFGRLAARRTDLGRIESRPFHDVNIKERSPPGRLGRMEWSIVVKRTFER